MATAGLGTAVLTISDTRTPETDKSGDYLCEALTGAGHRVVDRRIVIDDRYLLRAVVSAWIADESVEAIITTGGTGFTGRDATPEALSPLFDVTIEGFGEIFRQVSFEEIGNSTIQSRAIGGMANNTVIFCLPGSTGACRTGWERILRDQLDASHRPCNFAELIKTGTHDH